LEKNKLFAFFPTQNIKIDADYSLEETTMARSITIFKVVGRVGHPSGPQFQPSVAY